ncbi:MAG: hypothetical protein ACYC6A_12080 [Armatimonadota bacterium]
MLTWDPEERILTYDLTAVTDGITKHRLNGHDLTVQDVFHGDFAHFANRANFGSIFISPEGKATGPVAAHWLGTIPVPSTVGEHLVVSDTFRVQIEVMPEELAAPFGAEL